MATLTLSNTFLETDLSGLIAPSTALDTFNHVSDDLSSAEFDDFDSESVTESANTITIKNPTFFGSYVYDIVGTVTFKYDADDNLTSANASFSSVTIKDVRETITIRATLKVALTYDARNDAFKLSGSDNFTSLSSVYDDRSKWSLSVATVSSYSYDSATDTGTSSRSETFTGFATSDSLGNSAAFNGKIAYSVKDDDYTGFFTSASF
jgi:hypothetical protein